MNLDNVWHFFSHPYLRVVADGNAIAENSPESFTQLCDDIKNKDISLFVGIDMVNKIVLHPHSTSHAIK